MTVNHVEAQVGQAVHTWEGWLAAWEPPRHRARPRVCRKCTGSPVVAASGITGDTPHQVVHALVSRMHRIIESEVDSYTAQHLPMLQSELDGAALWRSGGYDPSGGLEVEYDGVDVDEVDTQQGQPFLFTFAELQAAEQPPQALPRPPLTEDEKRQLKMEIEVADRKAAEAGQEVCFALLGYQAAIRQAIRRFVDPQVQQLLDELSRNLQPPGLDPFRG